MPKAESDGQIGFSFASSSLKLAFGFRWVKDEFLIINNGLIKTYNEGLPAG